MKSHMGPAVSGGTPRVQERPEMTKNPHTIFLYFALALGLFFTFLTPPFHAHDERDHLVQIIKYSQGSWLHGEAPRSFVETQQEWNVEFENFNYPSQPSYRYEKLETVPNSDNVQLPITRSMMYSPLNYLGALPLVWIVWHITTNPLAVLYAARIGTFLAGTGLLYLAIRITPMFKWAFMLVALFPATVFIRSCVSADPLNLAYIMLYIALLLKTLADSAPITPKRLLHFTILSLLICLSKGLYLWVSPLFLLIPPHRFPSRRFHLLAIFFVIAVPMALSLSWMLMVQGPIDAASINWVHNTTQIDASKIYWPPESINMHNYPMLYKTHCIS